MLSPLIQELIESLRCLPGVGPKSAQRMTFHLLERAKDKGLQLAESLKKTIDQVDHCQRCRTFSETEICQLCSSPKRNQQLLCIVETPADVIALEQTGNYRGLYFVLMGHLSPLDGIGPKEIGIELLSQRMQAETIDEIIIATNSTIEGEATAHYIATLSNAKGITCSRIAHGIPAGGELEYLDELTLTRALEARRHIEV